MRYEGESNFDKAAKFLLNLALLILLAVGLGKVVIPEIKEMVREWAAPARPTTANVSIDH